MPNSPPQFRFQFQVVPLTTVSTSNNGTGVIYNIAPQTSVVIVPLIAHDLRGARNLHGRLALVDENNAIVAEAAVPMLSETTRKKIVTPVEVAEIPNPEPAPIEPTPLPYSPTPAVSGIEIRAQNRALLQQSAAFLGIPEEAIRDTDSMSLRLIVERYYAEFHRPCWVVRPSGSRPRTFVLTYVDLTDAQPGIAERQVELVVNELEQLQYLRLIVDGAQAAPCARTMTELLQRFFPYLQTALTAVAYRRDVPKSV